MNLKNKNKISVDERLINSNVLLYSFIKSPDYITYPLKSKDPFVKIKIDPLNIQKSKK